MEDCKRMRKLLLAIATVFVVAVSFGTATFGQNSGWKPLFNGKDLTGWKHVGPGGDTVEDGLIRNLARQAHILR